MYRLIRKIHIYLGLLNFTILLVFGAAGLSATFEAETVFQQKSPPAVRTVTFDPPPNLSDREVAARAWEALRIPLTSPLPDFAIRRNARNELQLDFYSPRGVDRAVWLEGERQLRVETRRNSLWRYLNNMHAHTPGERDRDWRVILWSWYVEFSIWSLLAMALGGVYLWLASRPKHRWAQVSFAAGTAVFAILYVVTR